MKEDKTNPIRNVIYFCVGPFVIFTVLVFAMLLTETTLGFLVGPLHVSKKELLRLVWSPLSLILSAGFGVFFFFKFFHRSVRAKFTKWAMYLVSALIGAVYFLIMILLIYEFSEFLLPIVMPRL